MQNRRDILERVAAGELDPAEAARLLAGTGDAPPRQPPSSDPAVERLVINCELGNVRVVGDPAIATVDVSGPHELRTEGNALVVRTEEGVTGFVIGSSRSGSKPGFRAGRWGKEEEVVIRANPALDLRLHLAAGKALVTGMTGAIVGKVELGALVIEDFAGPIDLTVDAGSVSARGRLVSGASRVRCELGKVQVRLTEDSSVRIDARTEIGSITLPGGVRTGGLSGEQSVTVGAGVATLEVQVAAGKVDVRT